MKISLRQASFLSFHVIFFFIAQSIYAFFYANTALRSNELLQFIVRPVIWVGPIFANLIISRTNPLDYLKLRGHYLQGLLWGILLGGFMILYNLGAFYLQMQHMGFRYNDFLSGAQAFFSFGSILAITTEEILFRGFFFQKLAEQTSPVLANGVQAALFVLIHWIGWTILGVPFSPMASGLFLLLFAGLQGVVLIKSNSLWACVLIHMCNNFMTQNML